MHKNYESCTTSTAKYQFCICQMHCRRPKTCRASSQTRLITVIPLSFHTPPYPSFISSYLILLGVNSMYSIVKYQSNLRNTSLGAFAWYFQLQEMLHYLSQCNFGSVSTAKIHKCTFEYISINFGTKTVRQSGNSLDLLSWAARFCQFWSTVYEFYYTNVFLIKHCSWMAGISASHLVVLPG
jgi:hypothetical protein